MPENKHPLTSDIELNIDTEFHDLIPPLTEEEYRGLEESVIRVGCRDNLIVWNDTIIDGHNRYAICRKYGVDYYTTEASFDSRDDVKAWIIRNQFSRRNLNAYQRSNLALILEPLIAAKGKEKQREHGNTAPGKKKSLLENSPKVINARKELAKIAGVSDNTIGKAKKIKEKATPEQKKKLEEGETSINQVHKQIRTREHREERTQELLDLSQKPVEELGTFGRFPVLYADPPWQYEHSQSDSRKIENQYPTMTLDDIKAIGIDKLTTDDCILFLWATSPKLAEAMEVIKAWEFNYRTCMVWVKDKIGMGYYARQRHELILIAIKGNMLTPAPGARPDSVIQTPRTEHSKKPEVMYELIEQMYPELPKIELFARKKRRGWYAWGNQSS